MKKTPILLLAALLLAILYSCNDDSKIGSSIVQDEIDVVVDSSFTFTAHSISNNAVQSRTVAQLIGRIDARGFGRLSSDIVTQFMPSSVLDTTGITAADIDSMVLVMSVNVGEFIGDSVVPMGLEVYPLTKALPSPIYSDFDPSGYYDPNRLLASKIYNLSAASQDTLYYSSVRQITVTMPRALARDFYNEYVKNPSVFSSPSAFAGYFPGVYIRNSFGSGRVSRITSTVMSMYYHRTYVNDAGRDTTVNKLGNYFAVTPEIITNNNISLEIAPDVEKLVDAGEAIVMAPAGLDVEMRFPLPEIMASYRDRNTDISVVNTLTFSIPGEYIDVNDEIAMPPYLLMVLSKDKDKFFAENKLPDNKTSFYATYNSSTKQYSFGDMRQYLIDMLDKESVSADDYTFTITPVSAIFENSNNSYYYQQQTLTGMTPYVSSPILCRLLIDKAKAKLTYSLQTIGD